MTVTHEDLAGRLETIEADMEKRARQSDVHAAAFESKLTAILSSVGEVKKEVVKTREVVEAFDTLKNVARFVKWASTAAAGILALWVFLKAMARGLISG